MSPVFSTPLVPASEGGGRTHPTPHPLDKEGKPLMYLRGGQVSTRHEPAPRGNPSNTLRLNPNQSMTLPPGEQAGAFRDAFVRDTKYGYSWGKHPEMSPHHQSQLEEMLTQHHDAFAFKPDDLTGFRGPDSSKFTIPLQTDSGIFTRARRKSPKELELIDEKCQELVDLGFLVKAPLPAKYASETTCPGKKSAETGEWTERRFCGDYRAINAHTVPDRGQIPLPEDLFDVACRCKYFSKLDFKSGFAQIWIAPEDQPKTAIWWRDELWMYTRMPFGMRNAPVHFQRVATNLLIEGGAHAFARVYIDDVIIFSHTAEDHLHHIAHVLKVIAASGLKVHPKKSVFFAAGLEYLGFFLSAHGLSPVEAKTVAFRKLRPPTNKDEVKVALGLFGYYRSFCPSFSVIAQPITKLLRKDQPWMWGKEQVDAFEALKDSLCTPGLVLRAVDPNKPIFIHTDFSGHGIGALLVQPGVPGTEYVCAAISRSLNRHEASYSSFHGEMLACVWAVKMFHHFLFGRPFTIVTDHQPLTYLLTQRDLTGKPARWALMLAEYDITIVHRPGTSHQDADALSRLVAEDLSSDDFTGARLDGPPRDASPCETKEDAATVLVAASSLDPQVWDQTLAAWGALMASLPQDSSGMQVWPTPYACLPGYYDGETDEFGVQPTKVLCTKLIHLSFFNMAALEGVTVYEPFGGMCAGVDALLQSGVKVARYLYSDKDPSARSIAQHRVKQLSARFPLAFPSTTWEEMFAIPQDVTFITTLDLLQAGALDQSQWVIVAGWECQDLSSAGKGLGLEGMHSRTFFDLLRMIGTLQQLQRERPPAYLLENVALQHNHSSAYIRDVASPYVNSCLGVPVTVDACQLGSYAHRLRSYWTNLCDTTMLQGVLSHTRPPPRTVKEILSPNRYPQVVLHSDKAPYYRANIANPSGPSERVALPTLMAHPNSYAFREGGPGMVWDEQLGHLTQPNVEERERAMGYPVGSTAAPGVSDQSRRSALGRAMDGWAMRAIIAAIILVSRSHKPQPSCLYTLSQSLHAGAVDYHNASMLAAVAEDQETGSPSQEDTQSPVLADIWADRVALTYLRDRVEPSNPTEARRVQRRALFYFFGGQGKLSRVMPDGSNRTVPRPPERLAIVKETHQRCGHFGQKRTRSLLLSSFWWVGMSRDVEHVVKSCQACARANATFSTAHPTMQSVPEVGLFYRWNADLCGPFPTTDTGYKYVMVCIESLSKHIECIPLKSKDSAVVAQAFLTHVIGRFGACAEVLTDQGTEFQGAFHALLTSCLIDHRLTSPNHPQANGMSERCVQTVKKALRKLTEEEGSTKSWDRLLPWMVLGYLCSVQSATGMSPYHLLYAQRPIVPPAVYERMLQPINFDEPEHAARSLIIRAKIVQRQVPIAMSNNLVAQHRDTLRYATIKGGAFVPRLRRFQAGDFVYVRRRNADNTLQLSSQPEILRVREVLPQGTLRLFGQCGQEVTMHSTNCTPCHLLHIDPTVRPSLARPTLQHKCELCRSAEDHAHMILCSLCNSGWHTTCFVPPLSRVPDGDWFCPVCQAVGRVPDTPLELLPTPPLPPAFVPASPALPSPPQSALRRSARSPLKSVCFRDS